MNSTELAVLRQRCDRGETFTAEEMEYVITCLESRMGEDIEIGCGFCGWDCTAEWAEEEEDAVA